MSFNTKAKGKGIEQEAAETAGDLQNSQKPDVESTVKLKAGREAARNFQDDDSACMTGALPSPTDSVSSLMIYPFGRQTTGPDEGRDSTDRLFTEEQLKNTIDAFIHDFHDEVLDHVRSSKTPLFTPAEPKYLMRTIRLILEDLPDTPEYQYTTEYITQIPHGRLLSGEVEEGNFRFRFRLVGEKEDVVVPFEVRTVATMTETPKKKPKRWWQCWRKWGTRKSMAQKRDECYTF